RAGHTGCTPLPTSRTCCGLRPLRLRWPNDRVHLPGRPCGPVRCNALFGVPSRPVTSAHHLPGPIRYGSSSPSTFWLGLVVVYAPPSCQDAVSVHPIASATRTTSAYGSACVTAGSAPPTCQT